MELEVFVHGALCYCYSGQCLFAACLADEAETVEDVPSHVVCHIIWQSRIGQKMLIC